MARLDGTEYKIGMYAIMRLFRRLFNPIKREDLTFIAIDVETTGLDPAACGLVQIGWQVVEKGRLLESMQMTVKPAYHGEKRCAVDDDDICRENDRLWRNDSFEWSHTVLACIKRAGEHLKERTGTRPFLAFHNAPFDMSFICVDQALNRNPARFLFQESDGPFSRRLFDTQAMVQPLVMRGQLKSQSLKGVCEMLGVRPGNHTAAEDARATAECVIKLLTGGWV